MPRLLNLRHRLLGPPVVQSEAPLLDRIVLWGIPNGCRFSANGMDRLLPQSQQVGLLRLYLLTIGAASHGKYHKN